MTLTKLHLSAQRDERSRLPQTLDAIAHIDSDERYAPVVDPATR